MNDKEYMIIALKEAKKAYKKNEVPIGAIIVKNNKIISKAYNKKEKTQISTQHAELLAINKACRRLKTWHLDDCILYTTLEPCMMCAGAIVQSHIKKIVYSLANPKFGGIENSNEFKNNKYVIIKGIYEEKSLILMKNFFKNKR